MMFEPLVVQLIALPHTVIPFAVQASKGQVGIIQVLLRAGADVDAVDEYGSAPLHRYGHHSLPCYSGS